MGFGEYSHAAHQALIRRRSGRGEPGARSSGISPLMEPRNTRREARDSDEHPASLGVVFALDVTGSMARVASELAERTLPTFMQTLLDARVPDPQVCFVAVGHATDRAPLQVGQFESTASLIDAWLGRIWHEGGGVGRHEAYEIALYYAARHMELDSVEKRGQRGFLFLTADVAPNPAVSRVEVQRILGDDLPDDVPLRTLVTEVQRCWEPFVLLASSAGPRVERSWRDVLGDRVVRMERTEDAAHLASGLVALLHGSVGSLDTFVHRLEVSGVKRKQAARIARALVPFAASIGRDGAPRKVRRPLDLPVGDAPSGLERSS